MGARRERSGQGRSPLQARAVPLGEHLRQAGVALAGAPSDALAGLLASVRVLPGDATAPTPQSLPDEAGAGLPCARERPADGDDLVPRMTEVRDVAAATRSNWRVPNSHVDAPQLCRSSQILDYVCATLLSRGVPNVLAFGHRRVRRTPPTMALWCTPPVLTRSTFVHGLPLPGIWARRSDQLGRQLHAVQGRTHDAQQRN